MLFARYNEHELERIALIACIVFIVDCANSPEIVAGRKAGDFRAGAGDFALNHDLIEHRSGAHLQFVGLRCGNKLPGELNWIVLRVGDDYRCKVDRLVQFRWSEHLALRDSSTGSERCALPLADVEMLATTIEFGASGVDGDFLLIRLRIAANRRPAVRPHRGNRIFERNFRFRTWNFPRASGKVYLARGDVHADFRRAILLYDVVFDGD